MAGGRRAALRSLFFNRSGSSVFSAAPDCPLSIDEIDTKNKAYMKNFNFVDCSFYTEVYSLQRKMGAFSALQRKKAQKELFILRE